MAGKDNIVEELKALLEMRARTFEERLSRIGTSRQNTGRLQEAPAGENQPPADFEGAATNEQAGFACSRRVGVATHSLLRTIGGEVEIVARGSNLVVGCREISSIKADVPNYGSIVEFPLWKRRSEGFSLANDCMKAFGTVTDMQVDLSPSRFVDLLDQGFSEIGVRRARIAWTC